MNKKILIAVLGMLILNAPLAVVTAGPDHGIRIKDGQLMYRIGHYLEGFPLEFGFDPYGYNYQSLMFEGSYANTYLGGDGLPPYEGDTDAYYQRLVDEAIVADLAAAEALMSAKWYWPYRDIKLMMKWNETWLDNADKDGDLALDRHYGFTSYIGSGAWLTNHMTGRGENGVEWTYFTKIVAAPIDAVTTDGVWYAADGTEIGPVIWGSFATIQDVESSLGATYVSPAGPGFGHF